MLDKEKLENSQDNWNARNYATDASFVPRLTSKVISYLDPSSNDAILDIGAGDGVLTSGIKQRCQTVLAVDSSTSFMESCKAKGLDVRLVDCRNLSSEKDLRESFNKVFSNAALHWILGDKQTRATVFPAIYQCLKPKGIFVAECGCFGNVADVVTAIRSSFVHHGLSFEAVDAANPWFFATPLEMRHMLESAGFVVRELEQEHRPTELPGDIITWVETFAFSFLNLVVDATIRAKLLQEIKEALRWSCQRSDGVWVVNYRPTGWAPDCANPAQVMNPSRRASLLPSESTSPPASQLTPHRKLFTSSVSTSTISQFQHMDLKANRDPECTRRNSLLETFVLGDTVVTPLRAQGIVKFIGQIKGKPGVFVGISLIGDSTGKGKNNGSFQGVEYFKTGKDNGLFLLYSKVRKLDISTLSATKSPNFTNSTSSSQSTFSTPPRLTHQSATPHSLERDGICHSEKSVKNERSGQLRSDTLPPFNRVRNSDQEYEAVNDSCSAPYRNEITKGYHEQASRPKSTEIEKTNADMDKLNLEIATQRSTIDDLCTTIDRLRSRVSVLETNNQEVVSELSITQTQLDEKDIIILKLEDKIEAKREEFRCVLESLEQCHSETTKAYENRLLDMEYRDVEGVVEQLKTLEDVISALEEGLLISEEETKRARESAGVAINITKRTDFLTAANEQLQKSNKSLKDEIQGLKNLLSSISTSRFDRSPKALDMGKSAIKLEQLQTQIRMGHKRSQPSLLSGNELRIDSGNEESQLWCEICESYGHDILNCEADFVYAGKLVGREKDDKFCEHCRESNKTDLFHTSDTCPYIDTSF